MLLRRIKQVFEDYSKYVVKQSRTNLSKQNKNVNKKLYNSIVGKVKVRQDTIKLIFEMEEYGIYQDKGVRGSKGHYADKATAESPFVYRTKMPPIDVIGDWAKKKNIRLRDAKGKYAKGNYKTIGFLFARSIKEKGIRASLFFTKPLNARMDYFLSELAKAVGDDFEMDLQNEKG